MTCKSYCALQSSKENPTGTGTNGPVAVIFRILKFSWDETGLRSTVTGRSAASWHERNRSASEKDRPGEGLSHGAVSGTLRFRRARAMDGMGRSYRHCGGTHRAQYRCAHAPVRTASHAGTGESSDTGACRGRGDSCGGADFSG